MLNNQIVAISGGVGRIGSALSRAVVENGGRVIIGDINSELGEQLVLELGDNVSLFFKGNYLKKENYLLVTDSSNFFKDPKNFL